MRKTEIPDEELKKVIEKIPASFTILHFVDMLQETFPMVWAVRRWLRHQVLCNDLSEQQAHIIFEKNKARSA